MRTPISLLLLLLAWLPSSVVAQGGSLASAIESLPNCALKCLVSGIAESPCGINDQTCICTNAQLQSSVEACVLQSCTVKEGLVTKNVTTTTCGAPIRDRSGLYTTVSNTLAVISATCVLLRLFYKLVMTVSELGLDDLFIFITLIAGVPSSIINVHGTTANGLGRDIWTLRPSQITNFARFFYVMEILYFAQITLWKMSILFFYLRIFPGKPVRRVAWATVAFNAVFGIIFVIIAIFPCRPISYYWTNWDGEHKGKCISLNALGWSNAAISITLDFWMLAIPISQLVHLRLEWKKKASVAAMFCVGTFVTVVSILRLQYLVHFATTKNPTWDYFNVSNWSTIEINVGIMCACMPALRVVFIRLLLPKVLGATRNTINKYKSGSHSHGRDGQDSGQSNATQRENTLVNTKTSGIWYGGHHGGQPKDQDEANLVQMEDLGPKEDATVRRSNASEEISL